MARLPPRGRGRRLADRRDGQGRRAVLPADRDLPAQPAAERAAHPGPRAGRHQHRPGRLRRRRDGAPRPRPGLDGRAFHLVHPRPQPVSEVYNAFAAALGAPQLLATMPAAVGGLAARVLGALGRVSAVAAGRDIALAELDIPPEVLPHLAFPTTFDATATRAALAGTGSSARSSPTTPPGSWTGGASTSTRTGPGAPARSAAGRAARRDHRRVVGHRPRDRAAGRPGRRGAAAGGAADRGAGEGPGRDRARRRPGLGLLVRHHRRRVGRHAGQDDARRPRGPTPASTCWSTTPGARSAARCASSSTGSTTSSARWRSTTSARSG